MTDSTPATHTADSSRPKLALTSIRVERAPGISPGFSIDTLSPDITVVFGPNASGKSTTARAIQSILWPSPATLRGHQLAAEFDLDGDHWQVTADAGSITRTRNGEPASPPLMAPIDDRTRYTLGLPDLLASENQPLAQAILTESSGGFDLHEAALSLGFDDTIPPRLQAAREVQLALNELHAAEEAERETLRDLSQRDSLLNARQAAVQAERGISGIEAALHLRAQESRLAEQRALVEGFAENVRRTTGEEPTQLADLANQIGAAQQKLSESLRMQDTWQRAIDAANLGAIDDPQALRSALAARDETRQELTTAITSTERELATAESERSAHQQRLAADINDDQIAALDAAGIRELATIAASYESIRNQRAARDELELWLGGVTPPENLGELNRGVDLLQVRLQHPNAAEHREVTGRVQIAAALGGVLTVFAGAALGILVNPWWWAMAVVGLILVILAWRLASSPSPKIAAELEREYSSLTLPQPEAWRMANVQSLLETLRSDLKVALVEQEKADRWNDLEQERQELDDAYADTERRREAAVATYGVAPDLKEESLRLIADNLGRWQGADAAVRGVNGKLAKLRTDLARTERAMRESLQLVGYGDGEMESQLLQLDRRIADSDHARGEYKALGHVISSRLQPEVDTITATRDAVFTDLDLQPGDTDALRSLLQQRRKYLNAQQELAERQAQTRSAAESTPARWREMDLSSLEGELDTARSTAATRSEIEERLRHLDQTERSAQRSHRRQRAAAHLANTRADLERERRQIAQRVIGETLARGIQRETRDTALPIVFHRARQLFGIITRGKYELQFEAGPPPEFTALDTASGTTLGLEQLSSGTRVQLLMAIRLAFVENVEIGPKLPVLLDETLGNSDELRAGAIIDAAIDICRNGRQVFYFTAQGDEVSRWLQRIEQMPVEDRPQISVVELAEVRKDAGFDRLPIRPVSASNRPHVPSPADYDEETLASALRVPAIDPWSESTGSTHLWHLVQQRDVLHNLLEEDVTTLGQLESLKRTNPEQLERIHPGVDTELAAVNARTTLIETAISMWRIGKARPMPTGVLADAEMIDAVALDEMHALQREVDNDGQALIELLQTMDDAPLAEKPLEALELWLISEGYIAQGTEMTISDIRRRLIEIASPAIRDGVLDPADVERVIESLELW